MAKLVKDAKKLDESRQRLARYIGYKDIAEESQGIAIIELKMNKIWQNNLKSQIPQAWEKKCQNLSK